MTEAIFVAAALAFAGFAKGIVGLGFPPISMGLLVLFMSPVSAASTMVVPSLLTNIFQAIQGPHVRSLLKRFWLVLILTFAGTAVFVGALSTYADIAIKVLGVLLIIYGAYSLFAPTFSLSPSNEAIIGPIAGFATGVVTAFTGVSSMPIVPFFQSIGLERDAFVQAMGMSFSTSALALILVLGISGDIFALSPVTLVAGIVASFVGMWVGARVRHRLSEKLFRRIFLVFLMVLGAYLLAR